MGSYGVQATSGIRFAIADFELFSDVVHLPSDGLCSCLCSSVFAGAGWFSCAIDSCSECSSS